MRWDHSPFPVPTGNHKLVFYICESISIIPHIYMWYNIHFYYFLDFTYELYSVFLSLWLISLTVIFPQLTSLQIAEFYYLWLSNIPLCVCVCVFIHSSVDKHLVRLHTLPILNNAAMNTGVYVPFWISVFIFSGYVSRTRIAMWCGSSVFSFWSLFILFSTVTAIIDIPISIIHGFCFLHILTICYL